MLSEITNQNYLDAASPRSPLRKTYTLPKPTATKELPLPELPELCSPPTASAAAFAIGNAGFILYAASPSVPCLHYGAWAVLASLLYNGGSSVFRTHALPPTKVTCSDVEMWVPAVTAGVNTALRLYERVFKCGEPRLTLYAAAAAYGLTLLTTCMSGFQLAWLAFVASFAVPAISRHGAYEPAKKAARRKLAEIASEENRATLQAKVPPAAVAHFEAARTNVSTDHLKFAGGSFALMVWLCAFGAFYKGLLAGFALLSYQAWASPEATAELSESASGKVRDMKQRARRLTMGAGELLGLNNVKEAKSA